ncbi:hypothetical protein SAMN05444285_11550 [Draconibacterium orientale]|jgi:hypothetical protein|uniref:Uncharacterized protein n=1 Tax=Draconibacterium orientale TaxID=1168034 RepID=X5DD97_9BACT|nr:hypothetical protein [Draconibacterium orientale]AHW58964.1 hypothetical protein FH5T_03395 [Draconibacterium orientale]SET52169.1 hypothetical protein SAMN05444285_11550 [Draconibacterium orientale]
MKQIFTLIILIGITLLSQAGNYKSYKVSVYVRAYEVEKMKDLNWLDSTWTIISDQAKIDKIYLETHRDLLIVPDETLEQAKKYFLDKGLEVGGGITYTIDESNSFETFCYSNPEHRDIVQQIAEHTARHFDDFILDDFFFTSCKSDIEIEAKGDMSWTEYRTKLMTEAGMDLVIKPAKKINPDVKIIIKYPNWYDHFQGLGFDLSNGPTMFDGVWTGTETRDPSSAQHLQNYLSYNIIRYFNNLRPGFNFGGWVDSGGSGMGMDRYAEQLWLTMFAKAPEVILFAYHQLLGTELHTEIHRTPWQGMGTSFNYDEMMKPVQTPNGKTITPSTIARVAGVALQQVDDVVSKLGNPVGIKSYKPFHSLGDDFLQNYLGMIGLPMDMYSDFPTDQQVVLLTEQAKYDPDIVNKMKKQLHKGGDVVITSALLKAIQEDIADIAELRASDLKALVNDFGYAGEIYKDILITQVKYQTNDAWEIVSAGRPLKGGVSGYPMLLRAKYSKGNLYVLTIPDDFGNLYDLPAGVLNTFRQVLSKDLGMYIEGPSKVGLFLYDNSTFIVESFRDEPVTIQLVSYEDLSEIKDLVSGIKLEKIQEDNSVQNRWRNPRETYKFRITLMPHSYKVFRKY